MTYHQWFEEHAMRHHQIVASLPPDMSLEEIVDYFRYDNMKEKHPDFCPLYVRGVKCHDMEELNCYLCGCPYFRFCDEGIDRIADKIRYSLCAIDSRKARYFESEKAQHLDCSECLLPHRRSFILKHFDRDWKRIMRECEQCDHNRAMSNGAIE